MWTYKWRTADCPSFGPARKPDLLSNFFKLILFVLRAALTLSLWLGISNAISFADPAGSAANPPASPDSSPISAAEAQPTPTPPIDLPARSVVYRTTSANAIQDYNADPWQVRRMIDALILNLTGASSIGSAWASFVKPTDVVGLKVCVNGAPLFSTHAAVVEAIAAGLREAGVPPQNIVVWDRDESQLLLAGYRKRSGGYRLEWSANNYDPKVALTSPVAGQLIYGDLLFVSLYGPNPREELQLAPRRTLSMNLSNESHLSNVLSREVTKVINLPVLDDNAYCGLSGALFNMTVQNVDNWRRLVQEPSRGDPYIPEMYADPRISSKVVLTIMDGLIALYAGGPTGDPNYAIHLGALFASKDPVAIDALALKYLDAWRLGARMNTATKLAHYVNSASQLQLGNSDLAKIDVRDVR
jgi:uncharacterized protein (DUF362 family)